VGYLRDLRGHFSTPPDAGLPCPHPCCNGSRAHPPGTPYRLSRQYARKLERQREADAARLAAHAAAVKKADRAHRRKHAPAAVRKAAERDSMRLAMHAQDLRAESYGMGYKAETAGFYGSAKHAAAERPERRLRAAEVDAEHRAQAEADREHAAAYRETGPDPHAADGIDWQAWA
jgi:hypothetical protein